MKKKLFFFLTVIFILISSFSFAQEAAEADSQKPAEEVSRIVFFTNVIPRLINREKNYTEALKRLLDYQEKHPEDFDSTYTYIKRIMDRRERYKKNVSKILKHIDEKPDDDEKIQAEIDDFSNDLEQNPPEEIAKLKRQLEQTYTFKVYANTIANLLKRSSEMTTSSALFTPVATRNRRGDAEKKDDAITMLKDALRNSEDTADKHPYFEVFFSDYRTSGYTDLIEKTDKVISDANKYIVDYQNEELQRDFETSIQTFISAVENDDYDLADDTFVQVTQMYKKYSDVRNKVFDCSSDLHDLFKEQQTLDPEVLDSSYIPFITRLITGSSNYEYSGILGAMDYKWNNTIELMKKAVTDKALSYSEKYISRLPADCLSETADFSVLANPKSHVSPIVNYSGLARAVNNLYNLQKTAETENTVKYEEYDASFEYLAGLSEQFVAIYKNIQALRDEEKQQKLILSEFEKGEGNPNFDSSKYVSLLFESVSKMSGITGSKQEMQLSNFKWGSKYTELQTVENIEENPQYYDFKKHTDLYESYISKVFDVADSAITVAWAKITDSYKKDADAFYVYLNDYEEYSTVYQDGFDKLLTNDVLKHLDNNPEALLTYAKSVPEQKEEQRFYYSNLTLQMTSYVKESADTYINSIVQKQNTLNNTMESHSDWKDIPEINNPVTGTVSYLENVKNKITSLKNKAVATTEKVQKQLVQADLAQEEADSYYERAQTALKRERLNEAQEYLEKANEKYSESLAIVENNQLRTSSDKKQSELSKQIVNAKNEIVVREAYELYNKAKDAVATDRYDDAETYINSAIAKWFETHEKEDKEPLFEDYKALINTAVSMKTGTELLPSDPLYAEMSQLLSMANQYLEEGRRLIKTDRAAGLKALDAASENVRKIKDVYFTNQKASLLELQIEQIKNPEEFEKLFAQKVKNAKAECKNAETQLSGYNKLIALSNLKPSDKTLKKDIEEVEISLGMRQRKVTNTSVNRAKTLCDEAEKYLKANNLEKAKERINEALRINPGYARAENLKMQVETKKGATTVITLKSEDYPLYKNAERAYSNGNYEDANMYINQLLSRNSGYKKVDIVADLIEKIEARM